jgi:uroporphyrinogen decarboxylase
MATIQDLINGKSVMPFWFMRQAGRYMSEYRELRQETRDKNMSFLDICYDKSYVSKITMQPINAFNLDTAIIFSDILVALDIIGFDVKFHEGKGPIVQYETIEKILESGFDMKKLMLISNGIKMTREVLGKERDLIGFCGSPWTLLCYAIDGGGSKDFHKTKAFVYQNPLLAGKLINLITDACLSLLAVQIQNGANIVKLFDSHSASCPADFYSKYIIEPSAYLVSEIKKLYQDITVICFPKGSGYMYKDFLASVKPDIMAIDQSLSNQEFAKLAHDSNVILQGNMDNYLLCYGSHDDIKSSFNKIKSDFGNSGFVFNLSHGILQYTPVENVKYLVDLLRS